LAIRERSWDADQKCQLHLFRGSAKGFSEFLELGAACLTQYDSLLSPTLLLVQAQTAERNGMTKHFSPPPLHYFVRSKAHQPALMSDTFMTSAPSFAANIITIPYCGQAFCQRLQNRALLKEHLLQ
jgi:hypothetical protein